MLSWPLIPFPHDFKLSEGFFPWSSQNPIQPRHLLAIASQADPGGLTIESRGERVVFDHAADLGREAYRLSVTSSLIRIASSHPNGRRHAVRTLIQLWDGEQVACCEIQDEPRFGWRGMMLDPSRHFLPKEFVLKFIELLAALKFNSLHLHLCDDQGWRIEIKKYPKLTEVGGWRKATPFRPGSDDNDGKPHGGFYTQEDLREIVQAAGERGINVVPEIEMPGHCQAALAAYPELGNTGIPLETGIRFGVIEDVYNVSDTTIRFLEDVLSEVLEIFPSPFIHVGGDEVPKTQWKASPDAQARMKEQGLANEEELQSWFIRHFDRWLAERGRRLVGWDEILEGGLAPGATVMSWRGFEGGIAAARQGHDVVMAPTGHCYFDHYQSRFKFQEPTAIGGYLPLEKVYAFEPVPPELSPTEAKHVLGGQGQLWSEYLTSTDQVEYMALPRMLALSEVLWGKRENADYAEFEVRVSQLLSRLGRAGWKFRPIRPELPEGYVLIGGWSIGDVGAEPKVLSFPVEVSGTFAIATHYAGGAYGVWIDQVEAVRRDGSIVVLLAGSTGNFDENNIAQFEDIGVVHEVRVTLRSKGSGPLENNNSGDVFLVKSQLG